MQADEQVTQAATTNTGRTATFTTRDGTGLLERTWTVASPKACVVVVHGYGEHCGRYGHVAERFNEEGFSVYSYDQRGHGKSPGKMGTVADFDLLSDDLDDFLREVRRLAGDVPIFLFGHSMGGLVLAVFAIKHSPDVRGLLFSSAGVKAADVSPALRIIATVLARIMPDQPVRELDISGLSRVPEVVDRYNKDPLVYHGKIGARTGRAMMKAIDFVGLHLGEITLPFIAMHGTKDRLVPYSASELLYAQAGSKDKSLKLYEGAYHEVFNDLGSNQFMDDAVNWMKAHL